MRSAALDSAGTLGTLSPSQPFGKRRGIADRSADQSGKQPLTQRPHAVDMPVTHTSGVEAGVGARLRARISGTTVAGRVVAGLVVALTSVLLIGTIMRNQAVLEFDGAEAGQHRRIKAFASEVRLAADALRDHRGDCAAGPAAKRAACFGDAARASQSAVAAARARYAMRSDGSAVAPDDIDPANGSSLSYSPAYAGR